jgi:tetratricopeptide (TPR) repeat protein
MAATQGFLRILALCVLLVGALATVGCGSADSRRASHIARGQQYLAEGKLEKARVEFGNALQIAPNDADARYLSGLVAERLGNMRQAAAHYHGAIDINPEHVKARAGLAHMYVFGGVPDKALELVAPALVKHPDDPDLLTVRAAARAQLKDVPGGLADAERAVKLAPDNENAVALLSGFYRQSGQQARAVELLEATLQRLPNSVDLRQVLANIYLGAGDRARAEEQLKRVIAIKPQLLSLRYQLAAFYIGGKQLDEAERTLKEAMAAAPESDEPKLAYAEFLATQRSSQQGEAALKEFVAREPREFNLQLGLGAMQLRAGKSAEALATYRAVIDGDPDGPAGVMARDRVAAIEIAAGRRDEALALIAEALKHNPRDNDALTMRGNLALERGDPVAAIADLRAVLRDQPGTVPVLRSLARAHLGNGEPQLAEEALHNAMQAAPRDTAVRMDLAQLLMQTQRADQAIALLEEGVRASPNDATLRETLVRSYFSRGDLDAARTAAEDLRTLRPDAAAGPLLAGLVAQAQKRPEDARRDFEQALKLAPNSPEALAALARLELARGEGDKAVALVRAAVEREPKSAVSHNLLGELYVATRAYPQAITALDQAIELAPNWWLPYRNLALAKAASGDRAGGLAAYEAGVRATHEPTLAVDLAALYEQLGRYDEAIHVYLDLHARNPRSELAANNLAMLLVTYRKDQASLDQARDLTAGFANSDVGALLDTHGWVMFKRGDVPQALPVLEKAAQQAPDSRVIRYHLGMAQFRAGQTEKARSSLESALAPGAPFTGTEEARSTLAQLKGRTS